MADSAVADIQLICVIGTLPVVFPTRKRLGTGCEAPLLVDTIADRARGEDVWGGS